MKLVMENQIVLRLGGTHTRNYKKLQITEKKLFTMSKQSVHKLGNNVYITLTCEKKR